MKHMGIKMPNFSEKEYRPEELKYMSKDIMYTTQRFRTDLKASVDPSRNPGAQARLTGRETSEHHVVSTEAGTIWKYSTATDLFCNCHIYKAWTVAINADYIGRTGVYFDVKDNQGKPHPMLHLGLKKDSLLWFRVAGKYKYSTDNDFYDELYKLFVQYRIHIEFN